MTGSRPCRVIVQHVKETEQWSYRLVIYEDRKVHPTLSFSSLEQLDRALSCAIPDLLMDRLRFREQAEATYIAYAGEWLLNDRQFSQLELARES